MPTLVSKHHSSLPKRGESGLLLTTIATAPCKHPEPLDGPLVLYGGGSLGKLASDYLQAIGRPLVMVLDQNPPAWAGVTVMKPTAVHKAAKELNYVAVSVVNEPYVPIQDSLAKMGFKHISPFYDVAESLRSHKHPLSNGWYAPILLGQASLLTTNVLDLWSDDVSRAHHLQFIAWRRVREEWTFDDAPVTPSNRYFIPEVVKGLHHSETFVDVGAYHGLVLADFIDIVDNKFKEILAFEPDDINRPFIEYNTDKDRRIGVLDCALARWDGIGLFHEGLGYSSQLSSTGSKSVSVRSIDSLKIKPTFLKVHVEGAELDVLKGAKRTLIHHRPIVAATVYHNNDGIWRTPYWLMETLIDYKFYFRLHSWCGTGAVVYAVPNERSNYG